VNSIFAHHFANVPTTRHPDQITLLEEEKITAYFGAGTFYAEPKRSEPLI
jgi:photosynthetic reaction center H subunit